MIDAGGAVFTIPHPDDIGAEVIWLWHEDGTGPAVFRWFRNTAAIHPGGGGAPELEVLDEAWEGEFSSLRPGDELPGGWEFCTGGPSTGLPVLPSVEVPPRDQLPPWLQSRLDSLAWAALD